MATIGPTLPPHLASKRKRSSSESSEDGPAPPPPPRSRSQSPKAATKTASTFPGSTNNKKSQENATGPRRVVGPSLPPVSLDELPSDAQPPQTSISEAEEDSSDDDIGPALPPPDGSLPAQATWEDVTQNTDSVEEPKKALQREEWMLAPPSGADWATRIDPTKIKSRKFNTMKGAKGSSNIGGQKGSSIGSSWTETTEQKRKRLQDEVMGTKPESNSSRTTTDAEKGRRKNEMEERQTEQRIREYNETHRGTASLLDQHRTRRDAPEEDDPSKRAFDREKDIAGGAVSALQRRDMLNKAKSMGSRFEKARYE